MRTLSNCEIKTISGAGFAEDITTVASTLIVGGAVAGAAFLSGSALLSPVKSMSGTAPAMPAINMALAAVSIALPTIALNNYLNSNPEVRDYAVGRAGHYLSSMF